MADLNNDKLVRVTFGGLTRVDVNALLRDPKVQATVTHLSKENERLRGRPGVTFVKPVKHDN
jgi:hypothetical protein